jgi:hypothetical protein
MPSARFPTAWQQGFAGILVDGVLAVKLKCVESLANQPVCVRPQAACHRPH